MNNEAERRSHLSQPNQPGNPTSPFTSRSIGATTPAASRSPLSVQGRHCMITQCARQHDKRNPHAGLDARMCSSLGSCRILLEQSPAAGRRPCLEDSSPGRFHRAASECSCEATDAHLISSRSCSGPQRRARGLAVARDAARQRNVAAKRQKHIANAVSSSISMDCPAHSL